jgi:lauroyl/myristoyl acyltransferase
LLLLPTDWIDDIATLPLTISARRFLNDRRIKLINSCGRVSRHLFTLLIEMVRLPAALFAGPTSTTNFRFQDPSTLEQAFHFRTLGRPIIVITGHFGNWEALSYATGLAGFVAHVIARRLDNPYLDAFLTRFRAATGQTILDKNTDFERIVDVLEKEVTSLRWPIRTLGHGASS